MKDHPYAWTMTVELYGESFETLKSVAKRVFQEISEAKSFKALPMGGGSSWTGATVGMGFTVKTKSPIEFQIEQLRKEADELEARLRGETADSPQ